MLRLVLFSSAVVIIIAVIVWGLATHWKFISSSSKDKSKDSGSDSVSGKSKDSGSASGKSKDSGSASDSVSGKSKDSGSASGKSKDSGSASGKSKDSGNVSNSSTNVSNKSSGANVSKSSASSSSSVVGSGGAGADSGGSGGAASGQDCQDANGNWNIGLNCKDANACGVNKNVQCDAHQCPCKNLEPNNGVNVCSIINRDAYGNLSDYSYCPYGIAGEYAQGPCTYLPGVIYNQNTFGFTCNQKPTPPSSHQSGSGKASDECIDGTKPVWCAHAQQWQCGKCADPEDSTESYNSPYTGNVFGVAQDPTASFTL